MPTDEQPIIGRPFAVEERAALEVAAGLPPHTVVVHDPPWSRLRERWPEPVRIVQAGNVDLAALEQLAYREPDESELIVGLGGGTALDTAKFLAWRTGKRLIQIPTIASVDAGFTDAIGVRDAGRVRYVGSVVPDLVVLDLPLIRSAPPHLNRAGIGDILSCHTGLHDWAAASAAGHLPLWRDDLAALGRSLLHDLAQAVEDICHATDAGVRFLLSAYRQVGAACAEVGHSRFEEGSEHFWAYAYEHASGAHLVHGELVCLAVAAMSVVQDNDPPWVHDVISRAGTRAHPAELGVTRGAFDTVLLGLRAYARAEHLEVGVADLRDITQADADGAWRFVTTLPRRVER